PDYVDTAGDPADHLARRRPDGDDGVIADRQRDYGRLFNYDALALHVHEDVRRAKVDSDPFAEHYYLVSAGLTAYRFFAGAQNDIAACGQLSSIISSAAQAQTKA